MQRVFDNMDRELENTKYIDSWYHRSYDLDWAKDTFVHVLIHIYVCLHLNESDSQSFGQMDPTCSVTESSNKQPSSPVTPHQEEEAASVENLCGLSFHSSLCCHLRNWHS